MAFFDLPLHELQTYQPTREEPGDFDQFWRESLAEARRHRVVWKSGNKHTCGVRIA